MAEILSSSTWISSLSDPDPSAAAAIRRSNLRNAKKEVAVGLTPFDSGCYSRGVLFRDEWNWDSGRRVFLFLPFPTQVLQANIPKLAATSPTSPQRPDEPGQPRFDSSHGMK